MRETIRLTATQAQQIALARVVLVDPPVVILDETTADAGSVGARTLEAGTHDELLATGGAYAELWGAWSAGRAHAARTVP